MTRVDRYILTLYVRVLAICFTSIAGLLIVVQVFTNLDEFTRFAEKSGQNLFTVMVHYFGPYVIAMFERLSGMLALLALLFVIAWLNKTNEFTALLAAGIPKKRVVKPLLIASAIVILGAAATRETVIPRYQDRLDRKPQDLTGDLPRAMRPIYDPKSQILLQGKHLLPIRAELAEANFKIYGGPIYDSIGPKLIAVSATYVTASKSHPAGYILHGVQTPVGIDQIADVFSTTQQALLLTARENSWLEPGSCFVASDIEYEMLRGGSTWKQYASTPELIAHLRGENQQRSHDVRVQIHQRLLRPFVDWTVLMLGIPILLTRPDRHMFWVAGACLAIVTGFTAVALGFAAIGSSGSLLSPMLATWLPLLIFLPYGWARTAGSMET